MEKHPQSLAEYAAAHPTPAPPADDPATAAARSYHDRQAEREKAEDIKQSILQQLREGNAPELILYSAITLIGITDAEWAAECKTILDSVYADLEQQSLFIDNAAVAAARLEKMRRSYTNKTRAQLQRNLNGCKRLSAALQEALNELEGIADERAEND